MEIPWLLKPLLCTFILANLHFPIAEEMFAAGMVGV